jgi:hypothetical protein
VAIDIAHQLYYAAATDLALRNSDQLEILNNKAMDMVRKEHMSVFHNQLPICNPSLGP